MKTEVVQDLCISCGSCISLAPEIYDWNDDQKAHAKGGGDVPGGMEKDAKEAAESCPTDAIRNN
ncbi:MAG TPA: ferredoxin [Bacillota bacterium]|nr:ferredoxin [Bacillota bacterium]